MALALSCLLVTNAARAQSAEGYLGWWPMATGLGYFDTPEEACEAQWNYIGHGPLSRFIGAKPPGENWTQRDCTWTTFQYLCPAETGGGISGCGTILPGYVRFYCSTGYTAVAGGQCIKTEDLFPERNQCSFNNGGNTNPDVGNPIILSSGSKSLGALDFQTDDGLFSIRRQYRSIPVGASAGFQSLPRGLAGGWNFDFTYEMQLGTFSGSPSSPNARLTLLAPDGTGYDFMLQSSGAWVPNTATGAVYAPTDLKLEFIGTLPGNLADIKTSSSQWRLTDGNDTVWEFQTFTRPNSGSYTLGRPVTRTTRDGYAWTFAYGSDSALDSITDSFGRQATFTWYDFYVSSLATPPSGSLPYPEAVATIALPDGTSLRYTYDPAPATSPPSTATIQRLIKAERLSSTSTVLDSSTYHYEDSRFPTHVTGITDNRNVRVTTYAYDARGRGILTEEADDANSYAVEYTENSSALTRTVTNPLGKESVFTFMRFATSPLDVRLTQVDGEASTNCPASVRTLTYGTDKFIATQVDEEGRTTATTRDAKGRPTVIVEAQGTADARTTAITWHSTLNVPASVVAPGLTETRTYNGAGQLQTVTQTDTTTHTVPYATNGRTRTWTYDWTATGLLESVDGPLPGTGDTVSYSYTAAGYLETRTDEVGHTTTITSHDGRGAPLTIEDENSVETVMTYDGMGRPLTVTVDPGGSQSQYVMEYDLAGNLTKLTMPGGGWLEYSYDDANRVTGIENDRGETQAFTLNTLGQATAEVTRNAATAITRQQGSAYDELGRLMQSIGAGSQTWAFEYDKVDNLTKTTDARSKEWQNGWDPLNRVIAQTDPEAATVAYAYAPNDALTQFKDGRDLATNRIVDGFGLTLFEASPDRGERTYWYDQADRRTQMVDAKGMTTQFTYDDAGRQLTQAFVGASSQDIAYSYDAVSGGNKGIGRLTGVTDASGSSAFVYDAQGRLVTDSKTIGGESYAVGYGYDGNGLVTTITYPSGHIVTYSRASDGKVTAISAKPSAMGSSTDIATGIAFAPFGPLTGLTYGNGLVLTRGHDQNYWLTGIELMDGGTALLDLTFARDANGGLTGVTDGASSGRAATFGYTDASRLAAGAGAWGDDSYAYDAAGNRTLVTIENGVTDFTEEAALSTTNNRINALYADGGPLTSDPNYAPGTSFAYSYDANQRLTGLKKNGVDIAAYAYDHAGLRVSASLLTGTPSTTHYIFAPDGRLLAEHDGATGDLIKEYIWLDDMPVALVAGSVSTPSYYYVHTGQIGEPLMVTDASKAKVWDAVIDPWGKAVMLSTATQDMNLRLPGQWHQAESGLSQNWMRDYDPALGRYAQADPLGIEAGQNLYAYVDGNPLNTSDPTGLQIVELMPLCMQNPALCAGIGKKFFDKFGPAPSVPKPSAVKNQCPIPEGEDEPPIDCEKLYENDTEVCNAISKRRGTVRGAACYKSASDRYAACLRGHPIPPLNTWNN